MDERKKSILATKTKEELFKLDLSKSLNGVGEYRDTLEVREKQDCLFDVYKVKKMRNKRKEGLLWTRNGNKFLLLSQRKNY